MRRFFSSRSSHSLPRLPSTPFAVPNPSSWSRATFSSTKRTLNSTKENPDPFNYTNGRWLLHDALQRKARYIQFDFDALRRRVVALCPSANSITSYTKLEGGNNRVFVFHTDNGKRVVARLPFLVAGPQRLVTNSEVATIQYLQQKTSIPIPKILEWSDDPSIIGSEYIIMEHAPGVPLQEIWESMSLHERLQCIKTMTFKLEELAKLDFPAYGSLYFANTPYISQTIPLNQEFSIGPHCGAVYWNCNVGQPKYFHDVKPNQGPWADLTAYCDALADNGISKLPPTDPPQMPRYHGSVQAHRQLIEQGRAVLKTLIMDSRIQNAAMPAMFHPDLHKRNIFVSEDDPTVISAFLDWQSTSIEPAFCYPHERPDFAEPIPDPSYKDGMEPKSWACTRAFHAGTVLLAPKLSPAQLMDETLFRPYLTINSSWRHGATGFRDDLIYLARRWQELGLTEPCPFPLPCPDELARHDKDYKGFKTMLEWKQLLAEKFGCGNDGWVYHELWEQSKLVHREFYEFMLKLVLEGEEGEEVEEQYRIETEEDLKKIWPFEPPERELEQP